MDVVHVVAVDDGRRELWFRRWLDVIATVVNRMMMKKKVMTTMMKKTKGKEGDNDSKFCCWVDEMKSGLGLEGAKT